MILKETLFLLVEIYNIYRCQKPSIDIVDPNITHWKNYLCHFNQNRTNAQIFTLIWIGICACSIYLGVRLVISVVSNMAEILRTTIQSKSSFYSYLKASQSHLNCP